MSRCFTPIEIPNKERPDAFYIVPCGQCIGCRFNRAEAWTSRMMHEASLHKENSFLTITYSPEHVPPSGSLDPRDMTLFIKRLRKELYPKKILYYYCGEYGEEFSRPHYHMALFGHDFSNDRTHHRTQGSYEIYRSPTLEKLWPFGFTEIGNLEYDSARYVAGYIQKKVNGKKALDHYTRIDPTGEVFTLHPEFSRMSRRPAIGLNWIKQFHTDIYNYDICVVGTKKLRPPTYYDKWLKKNDEPKFIQIKCARESSMMDEDTDPDELIKIYAAKAIAAKKVQRSYEGNAAPLSDQDRLDYFLRQQRNNHFFHKEKKNEQ